jgi:hypothetical protein
MSADKDTQPETPDKRATAPKRTPPPFERLFASPEFSFLGRLVINLVVFIAIAAAAFVFHLAVQLFEYLGMPQPMAAVLYVLAYCAFGLDVIWFAIALLKELVGLIEELVMGRRALIVLSLIVALSVAVALSGPIKSGLFATLRFIGSLGA